VGIESDRFRRMVVEILELDPRPNFYKGTPENPNPYMDSYGFRLGDLNVVYRMEGSQALVLSFEPWSRRRSSLNTPTDSDA
jgi:hypothetical protein